MTTAKSLLIVVLLSITNAVFAECTVFSGCAECEKYIEEFFDDDFTEIRKGFAYKSYPSVGTALGDLDRLGIRAAQLAFL